MANIVTINEDANTVTVVTDSFTITSGGSVATDAIWVAAGDLAVGTGSSTAARLAKGTAGQVLKVNAGATALEWGSTSGNGTVTSVSVTTANGVSGTVANDTSTPAISLTLGAITPTTVKGLTITTTTGTFTLANAKTFSVSNTLTLAGTDGSTLNVGTGGTLGTAAYTASTLYSQVANNLSDLASASTARTNLGLGTLATQSGTFSGTSSGTNTGDLALAGTPDYITIIGQVITRGLIDLTTDVTGVLPHGNLGTGGGGSTKFLREDGTYQTISGGGDALTSSSLDQFADVTQTAGKTLTITDNTTLSGGTHSGTNTGDQTNITGNAATVTTNANLTGHVTSVGNAAVLGSFTLAQLSTAVSDAEIARTSGTNTFSGTQTFSGAVVADTVEGTSGVSVGNASTPGTLTIYNGSGATFTSGIYSNASTPRSNYIPDADGDFVLHSATQTLTNKSIAATQLTGDVAVARIATALTTPGAIGGTTPSTGAFTTLSASSAISAATTIELGHASDTTLARVSAGVISVEGATLATVAGTVPAPTWSTLSGTSPAITFTAAEQHLTYTLPASNPTFTSSGYAQGYAANIYITGDTSTRTLGFPAWTWIGGAPTSLTANKKMQISLMCTGTTAGSVFAVYAVEP